jgi:hypothetical protein
MVVGYRSDAITVPWMVWFVFFTTVIIAAGFVGWFYPWFRLAAIYIVVVILTSWACLHHYRSREK